MPQVIINLAELDSGYPFGDGNLPETRICDETHNEVIVVFGSVELHMTWAQFDAIRKQMNQFAGDETPKESENEQCTSA